MIEKIRPLFDRVLIKRIPQDEKTQGGLFIPDSAKEKAQIGKVLAVGAGRIVGEGTTIPMQVKVGDVVFFGKYAGTEALGDNVIIREDEILGVVVE